MMTVIVNILLFVVLAFWLASTSSAANCPYKECSCSDNLVICDDLSEFPQLQKKPYINVIEQAGFWGDFTKVPSKSLPEDLIFIEFYSTPLSNLSEDAFENCANTLRALEFSITFLTELPTALRHLPNLTSLVINSSPIADWDNVTLQSLSGTLNNLVLTKVNLTAWPIWLSLFTSLNTLDLSYNNFTSIPEDAFTSMETTLTSLRLEHVGLTQLPAGLSSLVNLTKLQLNRNMFTDVNNESWTEQMNKFPLAHTLATLELDSVGLTAVPDLTGLAGLRRISMQSNEITEINSDNFPQNISDINLSNNNIIYITDASFRNCTAVERLTLSNNPVSSISSEAFSSLVNLNSISLDNSLIREFPQSLLNLKKLATIYLSGAPLECICPVNPQVVEWYSSFSGTLYATCVDGDDFRDYLLYYCETTTTSTITKTTAGDASTFNTHPVYRYFGLILLSLTSHYLY